MKDKVDWDAIRGRAFADVETPDDWPEGVRPVNLHGLTLLGVDQARGLYWDGKKLKTEVKLSWAATLIGGLIALFTFFAAVATVVMAVTDILRFMNGV
ncbi:hypothetical protein LJR235_002385 [Pararhizobium sp. LjRoot235]|uniref:hypothetical protein n=1 Tax=Pararhizobium sp. LjRoot235 TaxID=3342291 RepID=UPI003ECF1AF7